MKWLRSPDLPEQVTRFLSTHPRITLAVKSAVAAAIAWGVVKPLPGVADQYPYYAPLGAVVAVSGTVMASVRESMRGVLAILLGASVAWVVDVLFAPNFTTLAVVVAVGTLLAGWRPVGDMASWVPVSALFVLILGDAHPSQYVVAYAGLTALGTLVGVALNIVFPPLPVTATESAVARLQDTLADRLVGLADVLADGPSAGPDEWTRRQAEIEPTLRATRSMAQEVTDARRANWRARRWQPEVERQYARARTMEDLAFLVEELTSIVTHEDAERHDLTVGSPVRRRAADAVRATAGALRSVGAAGAGSRELWSADQAVQLLVQEARSTRARTRRDLFTVGSLVLTLEKALQSLRAGDHQT